MALFFCVIEYMFRIVFCKFLSYNTNIGTDNGFKAGVGSEVTAPIQNAINTFNELEGVADIPKEQFEEFATVLADVNSTEAEVHEQFDKLASSFINSTGLAYVGQNLDILRESLEEMGVTNAEEASEFMSLAESSDIARQYLTYYILQKELAENPLSTDRDVENLESLCESLGVTGDMLRLATRLKVILGRIDAGDTYDYSSEIASIQNQITELANAEYWNYMEDMYNNQLSIMDRISDAVQKRIDDEIDGYKKQKESIEETRNLEIEKLNEQITLLQKQNEEKNKQKELEEALYNLRRAESQRSQKIYTDHTGYTYKADSQSIREHADEVESIQLNIQISKIEEQITKLEESCKRETDAIDDIIDSLQKYRDDWQNVADSYQDSQC